MRWSRYTVIALIVAFIAFTIWYHMPTYHEQEYSFSTSQDEEKTTTILLKVKKYNKFFRPTAISGRLIYNNDVYETGIVGKDKNWLQNWREKLNGELEHTIFYSMTDSSRIKLNREQWYLFSGSDDLRYMIFIYNKNIEGEQAEVYAAPASNREEAVNIVNKLLTEDK